MDALLLCPIGICVFMGVILLIWSLLEHRNCGKLYEERHKMLVHILFLVALLSAAGFVVFLALSGERSLVLFYLMKDIPIYFRVDELGKFFVLIVTIVWVLVGIYSMVYLRHEGEEKRFLGFYLIIYGVLISLDFSGNLVTMYLFYELMTLSSFPLVLHSGSKESIMGALKYLFYSICGAYMGLFGIFTLYHYMGDLTFVAGGSLSVEVFAANSGRILLAVFVMLLGFSAKAGMFPLHAWLPSAHPVAPTPASAALSGIIVKSGVLAIIRVAYYLVGARLLSGTWVSNAFLVLALITVFMGSLLAFREPVLKKRLAYSTVSQVSYILFGLFLFTPLAMVGALMQVVYHAIVKCGLFLVAGIFLYEHHITRVEDLKGIGKKMPITLWAFTFLSLSLVGIPPTGGFVSKWYLAEGALSSGTGIFEIVGPIVLLVSALLTAGYLFPITMNGFFPGEEGEYQVKETSPIMWLVVVILAILALVFGIWPKPLIEYAGKLAILMWEV